MSLPSRREFGAVVPAALAAMILLITAFATPAEEPAPTVLFGHPSKPLTVVAGTEPATLALGISRLFYRRAPVVVLAAPGEPAASELAVRAAGRLKVPALVAGAGVAHELHRLQTEQVLTIGTSTRAAAGVDDVIHARAAAGSVDNGIAAIEAGGHLGRAVTNRTAALVVTRSARADAIAIGSARTAGATIVELPGGDPRTDAAARARLTAAPDTPVIALGSALAKDFPYTLAAVRSPARLPGGGDLIFPGRTMVALYGYPGSAALGVLGEKSLRATIARAKRTANAYQKLSTKPVIATFEIIATVASAGAGKDKDYSYEAPLPLLRRWVAAASKAGMYVVLDLQPGRSNFLDQAKRYESLLVKPNVGLALDPEWRLGKHQRPLRQIGSVDIAEINRTATWLAALTRKNALPQKLLILHQFQRQMIRHRSKLDRSHPELSILIHVDGQGPQAAKQDTWRAIRKGAPRGIGWGWKNFYDEDSPTLSVKKTWRTVKPRPNFISYQ